MASLKTSKNDKNVQQFLQAIADPDKKAFAIYLHDLMQHITGENPVMWGDSIIGFGTYHYRYESGREGDWFITGFSPRKQNMTVYIMPGFDRYEDLLSKLGKHSTGKSCLYLKKMQNIDLDQLSILIAESVKYMREKYG